MPISEVLEDECLARVDPLAAHCLEETSRGGVWLRVDLRAGEDSVHAVADAEVVHDVLDVLAAARRDDPHAAALGAELLAELPQRAVQPHGVEERGVELDLAPPEPVALAGSAMPRCVRNSSQRMPK